MLQVTGLDHIVINVADVERSLAWYVDKLGLAPERVDQWRAGKVPFPSARIDDTTIVDFFATEPSGQNVNHVCVVIEPVDLDALAGSGDLEVVSGPKDVWGAKGMGRSVYVLDPDGNVVELRCYPPE